AGRTSTRRVDETDHCKHEQRHHDEKDQAEFVPLKLYQVLPSDSETVRQKGPRSHLVFSPYPPLRCSKSPVRLQRNLLIRAVSHIVAGYMQKYVFQRWLQIFYRHYLPALPSHW